MPTIGACTIKEACVSYRPLAFMKLRNHAKMTWQGRPNWPPQWSGPYGPENPLPKGEVGVLKGVETRVGSFVGGCCPLVMHYNDQDYYNGKEQALAHVPDVILS